MIKQLRQRLPNLNPIDHWALGHMGQEAAVLLALTDEAEPHIILTKRAQTLSRHSGEVALPGGMIDRQDDSLFATALRESREEIDLNPSAVEVLGALDSMVTRFGIKVTPVVGIVPAVVLLAANPAEIDCIFRVPLDFFLRDQRLRTDCGTVNGHQIAVPCWDWQGHHIWGVTAIILVNFMNRVLDRDISTGIEALAQATHGTAVPQDWMPAK